MELRELRYFLAVYETGSVTAAAKRCFISQPSISAAIASLERELGALLFVRIARVSRRPRLRRRSTSVPGGWWTTRCR